MPSLPSAVEEFSSSNETAVVLEATTRPTVNDSRYAFTITGGSHYEWCFTKIVINQFLLVIVDKIVPTDMAAKTYKIKTCRDLHFPARKQCEACRTRRGANNCERRGDLFICICFFYFTNALLIVYTRVASAQDIVECSPRKLRERVTRKPSQSELAAECFEQDFDSKTPSEDIQFKRTWNAKGTSKQSRRRLGLPPAVFNLQKNRKRKPEAYVEHVIEGNVKIYRCPRMGWNSLTRRVIQHGFLLMGSPSEYGIQ